MGMLNWMSNKSAKSMANSMCLSFATIEQNLKNKGTEKVSDEEMLSLVLSTRPGWERQDGHNFRHTSGEKLGMDWIVVDSRRYVFEEYDKDPLIELISRVFSIEIGMDAFVNSDASLIIRQTVREFFPNRK